MNVMNIPFQSYTRLRRWYDANKGGEPFHAASLETYYAGMKRWLENMPATIRIFDFPMSYDRTLTIDYTDVQFELPLGENSSTQVYLMTLITPQFASQERAFADEIEIYDFDFGKTLDELTDPFGQPTVIWDCKSLDEAEIIKAVQAWSDKFWPDFDCTYVFEQIEEPIFEDVEGEIAPGVPEIECRVLLQCLPEQVDSIQHWAIQQGCKSVAVSQNHMVLIGGLPVSALSSIKSNWPNLPFVAESSPQVGS